MALTIPSHIESAHVVDAPLSYKWDDVDHWPQWSRSVPQLERKIDNVSLRGSVAFSAAAAEWVAWRLSRHTESTLLFDYIEAVWVGIVDWNLLTPGNLSPKLPLKEWRGPVLQPLALSTRLLSDAVQDAIRLEPVAADAVYQSNLVEHLIPDRAVYRKWRDWAIKRLIELTPIDEEATMGDPVPREALDPGSGYTPAKFKEANQAYLRSIDFEKNPYLRGATKQRTKVPSTHTPKG